MRPKKREGGERGARLKTQASSREDACVYPGLAQGRRSAGALGVHGTASPGSCGVGAPAAIGQIWSHAGCRAAFYVPGGQGGRVVRLRWCGWWSPSRAGRMVVLPGISCLGSLGWPHRCHPCTALRRTGTGRTARATCLDGQQHPSCIALSSITFGRMRGAAQASAAVTGWRIFKEPRGSRRSGGPSLARVGCDGGIVSALT